MERKDLVSQRVARLQWVLPVVIGVIVVTYQSLFVDIIHTLGGQQWHYLVEIIFYGMLGPIVTFFVLAWIRRWLVIKESAEGKVREQEKRLTLIKLEEGRRVSQHLHREVLPNLAYVANKMDQIRGKLSLEVPNNDKINQELIAVSGTLRETIGELRQKINLLRKGVSLHSLKEGSDFMAELRLRLREFEQLFKLRIQLILKGDEREISYLTKSALWRIVGESLNNVALHASAKAVELSFDFRDPEQVVLTVVDDGEGFAAEYELANSKGLGLIHMREEADRGNGTLMIQSRPKQGTQVTVAFPLLGEGDRLE